MLGNYVLNLRYFTYEKLTEITEEPSKLAYRTLREHMMENYSDEMNFELKKDIINKSNPKTKYISVPLDLTVFLKKICKDETINDFGNRIILKRLFNIELPPKQRRGEYYKLVLNNKTRKRLDELNVNRFVARNLLIKFLKINYGFECPKFERKTASSSTIYGTVTLRPEMKEFINKIRGDKGISEYCNNVICCVLNKYEKRKKLKNIL